MVKKNKFLIIILSTLILSIGIITPMQSFAEEGIAFTEDEQTLINHTQKEKPIKIGIIPHAFPLSECPPEFADFVGINVEMLKLITEKSGLKFEFFRIPLEKNTPFESLKNKDCLLVAGTIKLDTFLNNPELILSNRFCDGSAVCIADKDTNPNVPKTGKVAVMHGYQAGDVFANKQFPNYEIVHYSTNIEVMHAVRTGKVDLAMISRYVGIYELQNPLNEQLVSLAPYQMIVDSAVMGLNTPETQVAISIINKALAAIGDNEYNHVQMNFSITHPYDLTIWEFLFKYRYIFGIGSAAFFVFALLVANLLYSQKERKLLARDPLTDALSEAGFELAVSKIIGKTSKPLFITDFDICHFSSFNELNGKNKGDELLKNIVITVRSFLCEQDVVCRSYADNFKVLTCKDNVEDLIADIQKANIIFNKLAEGRILVKFGIYPITDAGVPISKMLDFAAMAKKNVKKNAERDIGVFDRDLHELHLSEAKMMSSFDNAIANKEFVAYYQPKYDVSTKQIVGAEALVRWICDGKMISPAFFIELFEKNGQIQRLDFYMLEQVCIFQQEMIKQNLPLVSISVNFSRVHFYSRDFISKINRLVEHYEIPKHLIEIECTETAMSYDTELTKDILGQLQDEGFAIAMDDFGKAYSSLNTLCAMPLDIIKLDSGFLLATLDNEKERANKIISGVISLAHDLSFKIIAEGVETEEQFLFLKSVGCDYIQGYYFSRPLDEQTFYALIKH